jgi:peptide deformylase
MAVREIVRYGNPVLRKMSEPVGKIDDEVKALVEDMYTTLRRAKGLGLAAPQVGVNLRVFIIDLTQVDFDAEPLVFINPEIIERQGSEIGEEGCLSFPGLFFEVERAESITVDYTDLDGNLKRMKTSGLLARAVQHENDHLNGKLFIDYLSATQRDLISGRLKKLKVG